MFILVKLLFLLFLLTETSIILFGTIQEWVSYYLPGKNRNRLDRCSNMKLRRCGMIANETSIHQGSNEEDLLQQREDANIDNRTA